MDGEDRTGENHLEIRIPENLTRRDFLAAWTLFAAAGAFGERKAVIPKRALDSSDNRQKPLGAGTVSKVQRIIIDTDPGVDDAIAILLA